MCIRDSLTAAPTDVFTPRILPGMGALTVMEPAAGAAAGAGAAGAGAGAGAAGAGAGAGAAGAGAAGLAAGAEAFPVKPSSTVTS